jgi:tetratricopeptide (TPR) repeat protein
LLLACALLPTGAGTAEAASKRDRANCEDVEERLDDDTIIASCTRVVTDRRESKKARAEAYISRGHAYNRKGDRDRAIGDYSEAIQLMPRKTTGYSARGQRYLEKGDHDRAIADFSEVIRLDLDAGKAFENAYDSRGTAYLGKGDYDRAIADHSEAIRLVVQGHNEDVRWGIADERATELWTRYYNRRGTAYRFRGDYDRALADYTKSIELVATRPEAHKGIGLVRYLEGDFKGAAAELKRAIDLDANAFETVPGDVHVLLFRYLASERGGGSAVAELEADARNAKSGKWPHAVFELYLGRRTPAATLGAAASPGERCEAHFHVGMWHLLKGDNAEAEKGLAVARDTCPKGVEAYPLAVAELARLQAAAAPAPAGPAKAAPATGKPATAADRAVELATLPCSRPISTGSPTAASRRWRGSSSRSCPREPAHNPAPLMT